MAIQEDINSPEFEVSFNFKNVLYVAQVSSKQGPDGPYFCVVYYSPNEKGEIPVLSPGQDSAKQTWTEPGHAHDPAFINEIGLQISKKNISI